MYPVMSHLAQSYFHQDYDLEADTPFGVVKKFCASEPSETVEALHTELVTLLDLDPVEEDLARIWLDEAGAAYDPRLEDVPVGDWLRRVADATASTT